MENFKFLPFLCLIFFVNSSTTNTQINPDSLTIKNKYNQQLSNTDNDKIDYVKKTDSVISEAERINQISFEKLKEIEREMKLNEKRQKKIEQIKKDISNNIKSTLNRLKRIKSIQPQLKQNNDKVDSTNQITKIDSVYVKGGLFKKSRWIYTLTFENGEVKNFEKK